MAGGVGGGLGFEGDGGGVGGGAESAFDDWYLNARDAQWGSFADVKATYADASWVGGLVVFNVGGNKYRIATRIDFEARMIFMLFVGTHREYDKGK